MKIYISGAITGHDEEVVLSKFGKAFWALKEKGHSLMSPDSLVNFKGFEHEDYMHICYAMIDVCDAIYMLKDWQTSRGARMELQYAADYQKQIFYEDEETREKNFPIIYGHPDTKCLETKL